MIPTRRFAFRSAIRIFALLAFCAALPSLQATQVRPVNIEQLTERAAKIFSGRCVETTSMLDPALGREVTLATFEVTHAVKGRLGETVTVKMLTAPATGTQEGRSVAGAPRFRPGEEVILFLYGESSLGLSSPVGLEQGKFSVFTDKEGRTIAVNGMGNRSLFRKLSPRAKERLGPEPERWKAREGVEPGALLDMVRALAR